MKNKLVSIQIILLYCILLVLPFSAYASQIELPSKTREFYVYDEAGIISSQDKNYIVSTNEKLYSETSTQIVVAVVKSLQGLPIEDYANKLYREWKIGGGEKNNGVLMLVAFDESKIRIEVGYGLEGAIPDITANQVIKNDIAPSFKEGKYSQGIRAGFDSLYKLSKGEYDIKGEKKDELITLPRILMAIAVIILIILDFRFFGGILTYSLIRMLFRGGRGGGGGSNQGGGGSSGGGGASGGW